jgi:dTDP-4-dehydrorhamnose 3,5-epimerase
MNRFPSLEKDATCYADDRGWLQVLYESDHLVLKRSFSKAGVFRGLHVQMEPSPQVKLIRVVEGRIIDFLVDVRETNGTIHRKELEPRDGWVRIDAHYAHGFYALEDTLFEYVCDGGYDEANEKAVSIVAFLEQELGLEKLTLSDKDRSAPPL